MKERWLAIYVIAHRMNSSTNEEGKIDMWVPIIIIKTIQY
jgi:hypothetical protein